MQSQVEYDEVVFSSIDEQLFAKKIRQRRSDLKKIYIACNHSIMKYLFHFDDENLDTRSEKAIAENVTSKYKKDERFTHTYKRKYNLNGVIQYCTVAELAVHHCLESLVENGFISNESDVFYLTQSSKDEIKRRISEHNEAGAKIDWRCYYFSGVFVDEDYDDIHHLNGFMDDLYLDKRIFFRPWIGREYLDGVNGKKTLVLGASRYCTESECTIREECMKADDSDYLELYEHIDNNCDMCVCKETHKRQGFRYINEVTITNYLHDRRHSEVIRDVKPESYRKFDDLFISEQIFPYRSSDDVWGHIAFSNYIEKMLDFYKTPKDTKRPILYLESYKAFLALIECLKPDIIISWGGPIHCFLEKQGFVNGMNLINKHNVQYQNMLHPSDSAFNPRRVSSTSTLEKMDKLRKAISVIKQSLNP